MTLTEEDAKKKWCPHVRSQLFQPDTSGSESNPPINRAEWNSNCIAGECMAWRWGDERRINGTSESPGPDYRRVNPGSFPGYEEWAVKVGYCGLAGAP